MTRSELLSALGQAVELLQANKTKEGIFLLCSLIGGLRHVRAQQDQKKEQG